MRKRKPIRSSFHYDGSTHYSSAWVVIKRSLERLNSPDIALHAGFFVVK
jgi:hypothetical protein